MRIQTAAALALALASAAGLGQDRPATAGETQGSFASSPAAPKMLNSASVTRVAPNYVIGAGDILQVSVWQEPQFGETVEVRPDGKISLPLASDISVAGLTPDRAEQDITQKLHGFVKHPRVTVIVAEVHSRIVYVIGEVQRPGPYPMTGPINVVQLIARAGGTTQRAKKKDVYVLRAGKSQKIPVNYKKILQGKRKSMSENVQLAAGDTIVVP